MGVRVLAYSIGLFGLLREIQYTLSQMSHEALAAPHVPAFQALRDGWQQVLNEEIAILDELSGAQAAINKADKGLDILAGRVSRIVNDNTDGSTRKQLRTALFKNKPLSRFRRPVLSGQLRGMSEWSETLAKCGVPELVALAPEVAPLVDAGQKAEQQRDKAQKKNRDFRDVGARKQFIDKVNAARKEAHGLLGKLPFQSSALPQDFADNFFYSEALRDEEETIDEVKTSIEELSEELEARRTLLKKLEEEAAMQAQAEQERQAAEQAAGDLEARAQELLKQAAAMKAKLKK
jgi:DNA repair exonuclease SbcCD ATPase subunit